MTKAAFAFSETLRDFSEHKHSFRHTGLRLYNAFEMETAWARARFTEDAENGVVVVMGKIIL